MDFEIRLGQRTYNTQQRDRKEEGWSSSLSVLLIRSYISISEISYPIGL